VNDTATTPSPPVVDGCGVALVPRKALVEKLASLQQVMEGHQHQMEALEEREDEFAEALHELPVKVSEASAGLLAFNQAGIHSRRQYLQLLHEASGTVAKYKRYLRDYPHNQQFNAVLELLVETCAILVQRELAAMAAVDSAAEHSQYPEKLGAYVACVSDFMTAYYDFSGDMAECRRSLEQFKDIAASYSAVLSQDTVVVAQQLGDMMEVLGSYDLAQQLAALEQALTDMEGVHHLLKGYHQMFTSLEAADEHSARTDVVEQFRGLLDSYHAMMEEEKGKAAARQNEIAVKSVEEE